MIQVNTKDGYSIIQLLSDKLDVNIAPDLKSEFTRLNAKGSKNIIIDLIKVKYCDSSGLSALLVGNRLTKNGGGKLIICSLRESVEKLIKISQLDTILAISSNLVEAELNINK